MEVLEGKVAVVTGGASGIGAALAERCAELGMDVAVADIEPGPAEKTAAAVRDRGRRALSMAVDVSRAESVEALAVRVDDYFGGCDLLCNNAGVALFRPAHAMQMEDWAWVLGVNLFGVIHGVQSFLPRMRARGAGGHILNTASIAGLSILPGSPLAAYCTSKYGVVALSESLREELAAGGIGVTVLCPGGVATRIGESERNRPDTLRGAAPPPPPIDVDAAAGDAQILDAAAVADLALEAVRRDEPYAITHPAFKPLLDRRVAELDAAFERATERLPSP